jgi:heat-inducible transcriptional repressor
MKRQERKTGGIDRESKVNMEEPQESMTERRKELLRTIINEYVNNYLPVSSEMIVNKYKLPISPATVRNEMAELEREGYITHPHTPAGRIPSDKGYRYYVEHLMERQGGLSLPEQHNIQHQFYQVQLELNEWIRLAAGVVARTSQNVGVVSSPYVFDGRLKRLEVIGVQERLALVVAVTQDGSIKEQMLSLEDPITQEELSIISNRLNATLQNQNRTQIEIKVRDLAEELDKIVATRLVEMLRSLEQYRDVQLYREGLANILNQPEFNNISTMRQVMQTIETGNALPTLIPEILQNYEGGVQVVIGGENRFDDMRLLSVVLARYGIDGQVVGVIGLVGSTRMEYNRSISTVQYIAHLMTNLLTERSGNNFIGPA